MIKNFTQSFYILVFMVLMGGVHTLKAQCPAGSATASLNWDNLDYMTRNGAYNAFVTNAMVQSQHFAIGVNRLSIDFPFGSMTTNGENTTNTAEAGSFGAGADVEYGGNGLITLTLDAEVQNLTFSLYDIDAGQKVQVTAEDAAATPLVVTMSNVLTGIVTITGSGTTAALATASATAAGNTDRRGSINISISGTNPAGATGVKKVYIDMGYGGGASGNFWLSGMTACVAGSFPVNYYASQKPFVGQPAYYLVTPDNNSVYLFDPLTGRTDWLFGEPGFPWVNSMAYDYAHKTLYYVGDNPSPVSSNKGLRKYDFNTETVSTVLPDLTTLGIPLFDIRVESAGAAFYNGSLFIGIEGTNAAKNSNRESTVWRIDFDAAQNPIRACQVFGVPADNGSGTLMHDWGDFTIKDGVLYDFNTGNQGSTAQFIHLNMQNGTTTAFPTNGNPAPIQVGQTWDGKLYWTGGQYPELGRVARYNENGTIGPKVVATVTACSPPWVGRAGDASDPFRPKSDFGDAPAYYDPIPDDRATHEYDCNLRLGPTFDREWDKTSSADATADGSDEDGITAVSLLAPGIGTFLQDVQVYNRTGTNATLVAWLDYNANGVFEPSEGVAMTITSSPLLRTFTLAWPNINVSLPTGSKTFLRVRLTSASNGMTTNNPTGWMSNGEIEDYEVFVDMVLPVKLLEFSARQQNNESVKLHWVSGLEENFRGYEIERSRDGLLWESIGFADGLDNGAETNIYDWTDDHPNSGDNFYRLKMLSTNGQFEYSQIVSAELMSGFTGVRLTPNPIAGYAELTLQAGRNQTISITVIDASGRIQFRKQLNVTKGFNNIPMPEWRNAAAGTYLIQVTLDQKIQVLRASVL